MNLEEFKIRNNQLIQLGRNINEKRKELTEMEEDFKKIHLELRSEARLQNIIQVNGEFIIEPRITS